MFAGHRLRPVDIVRPRIWNDDDVSPWYAQNTLLYVAEGHHLRGPELPLRLVHPRLFQFAIERERKLNDQPRTLRGLLSETGPALTRSLKWRMGRHEHQGRRQREDPP